MNDGLEPSHKEKDDGAKHEEHHRHHGPRKLGRSLKRIGLDLALEDRDERRRKRALPKQLAGHVGDGEGEGEGGLLHASADEARLEHLADKPEDAAQHGERADGEDVRECLL